LSKVFHPNQARQQEYLMSDSQNAFNCFQENLRLFGDSRKEPEKFNLYNGLSNLANAIGKMQSEIDQLKQEIHKLRVNK
jgi:hypothetical protein